MAPPGAGASHCSSTGRVQSHVGALDIHGVCVESIGDIQHRLEDSLPRRAPRWRRSCAGFARMFHSVLYLARTHVSYSASDAHTAETQSLWECWLRGRAGSTVVLASPDSPAQGETS